MSTALLGEGLRTGSPDRPDAPSDGVETAPHHFAAGTPGTDLSSWAAARLATLGWEADGLYVATSSAGGQESVGFWSAARETELGYANPRAFPWTLVNGPTGAISIALGIRGPTYTLVGQDDALLGALECAADDLAAGLVQAALLVAVDDVAGPVLAATLLSTLQQAEELSRRIAGRVPGRLPSATLAVP